MGERPAICGVTGIPIEIGDKVRVMLLTKIDRHYKTKPYVYLHPANDFAPFSLSFSAIYDGYGGIEKFPDDLTTFLPIINQNYKVKEYDKEEVDYELDFSDAGRFTELMENGELLNYRDGCSFFNEPDKPFPIVIFLMHEKAYDYARTAFDENKPTAEKIVNILYINMLNAFLKHNDNKFDIMRSLKEVFYNREIIDYEDTDTIHRIFNKDANYSDNDEFAVHMAFETCLDILISDNKDKGVIIRKILTACVNDVFLNDYISALGLNYMPTRMGNTLARNKYFSDHFTFVQKFAYDRRLEAWEIKEEEEEPEEKSEKSFPTMAEYVKAHEEFLDSKIGVDL